MSTKEARMPGFPIITANALQDWVPIDGKWHHVAVIIGPHLRLYIDGKAGRMNARMTFDEMRAAIEQGNGLEALRDSTDPIERVAFLLDIESRAAAVLPLLDLLEAECEEFREYLRQEAEDADGAYALDAAWAAAEAELPEGWEIGLRGPDSAECFSAWATPIWWVPEDVVPENAEGPTPAAALRALTDRLRERTG
jgi:hypothetical protein